MPNATQALIRDTLAYLKDPLLPKQTVFATAAECAALMPKSKLPNIPPSPLPSESAPVLPPKAQREVPKAVEPAPKKAEPKPPPIEKPAIKQSDPTPVAFDHIQHTLQKIAPQVKIVSQITDDTEAKRVASAWKEKVPDAEVVLIACDAEQETLDFLKVLAKAIDQQLAKSKILSGERMENEKRWDLFLEKNAFKLIILSSGMRNYTDLKRYYKQLPASAESFLNDTPALVLSEVAQYKMIEHKATLWKTLCRMLQQ